MWKFKNFSATQNLREIKVSDFRGLKTAILTHSEALKLDYLRIFAFFGG